jgi:hypothetical protein
MLMSMILSYICNMPMIRPGGLGQLPLRPPTEQKNNTNQGIIF